MRSFKLINRQQVVYIVRGNSLSSALTSMVFFGTEVREIKEDKDIFIGIISRGLVEHVLNISKSGRLNRYDLIAESLEDGSWMFYQ